MTSRGFAHWMPPDNGADGPRKASLLACTFDVCARHGTERGTGLLPTIPRRQMRKGLPMIVGESKMSEYRKASKRIEVSVGESLRILRELQEMSQNDLAIVTDIPRSTLSAMENGRACLGVDRAKALARALRFPPAVLVSPGRGVDEGSAA